MNYKWTLASVIGFLTWSSTVYAQFSGARAPRQNARLILNFQSDTLDENSEQRTNGRQRVLSVDADINVYKSKDYIFTVGGKVDSLDTGTENLKLGKGNVSVGNRLTDQIFTVSGKKSLNDEGESLGFALSYGSASDNSFGREKDSAVSLTATYSFAKREKSQWLLIANYSNNRAFLNNVPLPTFVYVYMPSKYFIASMGFPFVSLNWMDYKTYSYKLFLSPAGGGFNLAWQVFGPAMFYTNFDYKIQTFMHENRQKEEDRLFYEDKKIEVGLKSHLSKNMQLSLGAGYSFDRKIYEGESIFESELKKQDLGKDVYLNTKVTLNF